MLYSQNGPKNCVIEGNGISKGFKLTSGQTLETILNGFTVKKVSWAIYCKNSSSTIRNCIFTDADGISFNECDTLSLKNCDINSAHNTIFGLNIDKLLVEDCNITGTLHIIYISDCRFTKVKFWNNISSGSITLEMAKNAQFTDSIISGNRKNTGLYFTHGQQLTVNNCLFTGHKWACGSSANKADFTNCTFTQNYYPGGKTIQCRGSGINPQVNFTNCILWDEVNSISISSPIVANITYSNVRGGWAGLGNINCDPCFAELGYLDANGTPDNTFDDFWVDGDYHLKSEGWRWDARRSYWTYDRQTSRCIDAGSPGYSLGDEPLTVPPDPRNLWGENLRIDMGFYGGTAEASIPPYDWSLLSDIDNTGSVDFADYAHIAADYGQEDENLNGDLNRDGKITIDDIILLTDDWLLSTDWAGI